METDGTHLKDRADWQAAWLVTAFAFLALGILEWIGLESMAAMFPVDEALPAGLHLVFNLKWAFPALAVTPLIGLLLSARFEWARRRLILTWVWIGSGAMHVLSIGMIVFITTTLATGGMSRRIPKHLRTPVLAATSAEVFSVLPGFPVDPPPRTAEKFRRHSLLGKVSLTNSASVHALVSRIVESVETSRGWPALCFYPRHGVRLETPVGPVDFLICYECKRLEIWHKEKRSEVGIAHSSKPLLNEVLQDAGIPLAPEKPGK